MNADHTVRNTSVFVISFMVAFGLVLIVLASIAADALPALIAGVIVLGLITIGLSTIGVRLFVQWTDARVKAAEARNNFLLNMARAGLLPNERGGFTPIHTKQIAAPAQKKETAPADPRKQLLIELCLLTIRSDKYGPSSKRLMTADDAQARGGTFADRNKWAEASRYAQDHYFVYEKRGGTEQGLMVDSERTGGATVADLMSVLTRNPILDDAVNALPGIER